MGKEEGAGASKAAAKKAKKAAAGDKAGETALGGAVEAMEAPPAAETDAPVDAEEVKRRLAAAKAKAAKPKAQSAAATAMAEALARANGKGKKATGDKRASHNQAPPF